MKKFLTPGLLVALSATMLLTAACKKDKTDDPAPTPASPATGVSYKLDGTTITPSTFFASYSANALTIGGGLLSEQSLSFTVRNVRAAGTFTDGSLSYSKVAGTTSSTWISQPGSNSVVVTAIDTATHKVSGTFTASLVPVAGTAATGNKSITNGTFTNLTF